MKKMDLTIYASIAGTFLLHSKSVDAQLVYSDIDPDFYSNGNDIYPIDFNDDGINDIQFNFYEYTSYVYGENSIICSVAALNGGIYEQAIESMGFNINGDLSFNSDYWVFLYANNIAFPIYGDEFINNEVFIGCNFNVDGQTYYGWVRLCISSPGKLYSPVYFIRDYAYNATPGEGALTTFYAASIAENLFLEEFGETNTAADLYLSFGPACNQETVSEYRIVLTSDYVTTLPLDSIDSLDEDQFISILPNTVYDNINLSGILRDFEGNIITGGINYKAFIFSINDGILVTQNSVSVGSNPEYLNQNAAPTPSISLDYFPGDEGTITDFNVTFNYDEDTVGIGGIKLVVSPYDYLDLEDLLGLEDVYYHDVTLEDDNQYNFTLPADFYIYPDITPVFFEQYYLYVLTYPDSTNTSFISSKVNQAADLFYAPYFHLTPIIYDNYISNDSIDLIVDFPSVYFEDYLKSYNIFIAPASETIDAHNLTTDLGASKVSVTPDGNALHVTLPAHLEDYHSNPLITDSSYVCYVAMRKDSPYAYYILSDRSEQFTVANTPTPIDSVSEISFDILENSIIIYGDDSTNINVIITNITGELVYKALLTDAVTEIDINSYAPGIYLICIFTKEKTITKKFFHK